MYSLRRDILKTRPNEFGSMTARNGNKNLLMRNITIRQHNCTLLKCFTRPTNKHDHIKPPQSTFCSLTLFVPKHFLFTITFCSRTLFALEHILFHFKTCQQEQQQHSLFQDLRALLAVNIFFSISIFSKNRQFYSFDREQRSKVLKQALLLALNILKETKNFHDRTKKKLMEQKICKGNKNVQREQKLFQ